jgi:hypothetical protein
MSLADGVEPRWNSVHGNYWMLWNKDTLWIYHHAGLVEFGLI